MNSSFIRFPKNLALNSRLVKLFCMFSKRKEDLKRRKKELESQNLCQMQKKLHIFKKITHGSYSLISKV